jgi:hypothetical protein
MAKPAQRVRLHRSMTFNESDSTLGLQFDNDPALQDNNNLKWLLNDIVLSKIMQQRITQIAFGCISASLALFIIYRIWADSWRASKLRANLQPK